MERDPPLGFFAHYIRAMYNGWINEPGGQDLYAMSTGVTETLWDAIGDNIHGQIKSQGYAIITEFGLHVIHCRVRRDLRTAGAIPPEPENEEYDDG